MPSEDIAAESGARAGRAAARRTLRSRLRTPVGKAIVLAAMPSAALLGMGIGSPLAKAEPQPPPNPFQDRPCVEMPDEEPAGEADDRAAREETAQEEAASEEAAAEEDVPETRPPVPEDDAPARDETPAPPATGAEAGGGAAGEEEQAEAPPEEAQSAQDAQDAQEAEDAEGTEDAGDAARPWDPLGLGEGLEDLGNAVGDILTPGRGDGGDGGGEDTPPPDAPSEPGRPEDPEDTPEPPGDDGPGSGDPGLPDEPADPGADAGTQPETETEPDADADSDPDPGTEPDTEPGADDAAADDPFAPDEQGRLPYPCPEERSVPGTDEALPVVLPDEGWYLQATYLTLRGLDYEGVVNVTTSGGRTKQALKFTADQLDIGDLHQIVDGEGALRYHVGTATGSNSTFRNGRVTMYTERLEGNLFGVIPIVFDPEHEPPLDISFAFFTDVFVHQAGQFGGDLTLHGMEIYTTEDGPTPLPG
ncbi:hypothetical protein [Streptomyces sp. NPDC049879]|uniref:hypothetical protein n=1 Tax=Streptomyces sp. NPDC049879 TaxID=3365598 RepID=UPI0037B3D37A